MKRIILCITLWFLSFSFAYEFFEKTSIVSNSLGGVLYRDVPSVVLNPSIMNFFERSCFSASYTYLADNVSLSSLSYFDTLFGVNVSLVATQLYQDNILIKQDITDEGFNTSLRKLFGLLSFGYTFYGFSVAGSLKTVYYDIYNTKSNIPLGLDLGVAKKILEVGSYLSNKFSLTGLVSLNNIFGPNVKIGSYSERFPTRVRMSLNLNLSVFPRYNFKKELLLYDKISLFLDYSDKIYTGFEYNRDKFFLRFGYNPSTFKKYSFGFGAKFDSITLDYAFVPFLDFGIHSLAFSYLWGETKQTETTPSELEDFLQVQKKALRVAEKYCRDAEEFIKNKNYDSAIQILEKVVPLSKDVPKIDELLNIAKNAKVASLNTNLTADYNRYISQKDYFKAFDVVVSLCEEIPQEQTTKQILDDFNNQSIPLSYLGVITNKKTDFIEKVKENIKVYVEQSNFEKAEKELIKLQLLSYDDYIQQKNYVEKEKTKVASELVKKAIDYYRQKKYTYAYFYYYEAYKASKDKSILLQLEQLKEKFKQPSLYEELYFKKLFYLACVHFALDEYEQAKQVFFELRAKAPTFDYELLLDVLKEKRVVAIFELLK